MNKILLMFFLTSFVATAQSDKIPYLECDIKKSTYTKHDGEVIHVPPMIFRVKSGVDIVSSEFSIYPRWLDKLPHAWVHSVASDGKWFEHEYMGLTSSVTLSWRYEIKPGKIIMHSEYGTLFKGNYFTKAIRTMVIYRINGEITVFDDEGNINTKGKCKPVELKF